MTETPVDPNAKLDPGTIETRAADVDTLSGGVNTFSGSAVSFGEGVYLSVGHNFYQNDGVDGDATGTSPSGSSYRITLREGLSTDAGDERVTNADVTNIGNYVGDVSGLATPPTLPIGGRQDLAAVAVPGGTGPNSSAIVFQNPADIVGSVRSAGYPGAGGPLTSTLNPDTGLPYDTETMMLTEGTITQDGTPGSGSVRQSGAYQTEYLSTDLDQTSGGIMVEGLTAVGGQSGSGVDLATSLESADTRLDDVALENRLMGAVTYGSGTIFTNSAGRLQLDVNHTATDVGAGVTPLRPDSYQALADVAVQAAQDNETLRDAAAGGPATPLTDQEIADRFDTQTLIADQQAVDGSTSRFDGTGLNEISYMNQNVSINMDLGAGLDEANYFYLDRGIEATIGETSISIAKTYDTVTLTNPGPLGASIPMQTTAQATDTLLGAERITGTGSDDIYIVEDLSGVDTVDGRDLPAAPDGTVYAENDTFRLGDDVGPVSWTFDRNTDGTVNRESGTVGDGTHSVRFENMETVVTRDGDNVDGVVQGAVQDMPGIEGAVDESTTIEVPTHRAIEVLAEDEVVLRNSPDFDPSGPIGRLIDSPVGSEIYRNLHHAGVEIVPAQLAPDMPPEERVAELLRAGDQASRQAGLPSADEIERAQPVQSLPGRDVAAMENEIEEDYVV